MGQRIFMAIVVIMAVCVLPAAAQEVMFAYGFEEGSTLRYRVKLNQEADFGGNAMGQMADLEVTVKCVSVAEGAYGMEMTFDKADLSRTMFGNIASDPLSEAMVGKAVAYRVDNGGNVSDIKPVGYYEEWDRMQQFVETVVENWYVHLPGKAFSPGAGWDHTRKDKAEGGADVVSTSAYKYKEKKKESGRECALVAGEVTNEISGQANNPMGTFDVKGGGKGKVEFFYDPAAKLVVKYKAKMDVKMDLSPASGGAGNAITTNVTVQLERVLL